MRTTLLRSLALLLPLVLTACPKPPEVVEPPGEEQPDLDQAQRLEQAGKLQQAARLYLAEARKAASPQRERLQLRAARLLIQADQRSQAKPLLEQLPAQSLPPDAAAERGLLLARIAMAENRPEQALLHAPPPGDTLPQALRVDIHRLRSQALNANHNRIDALRERVLLDRLLESGDARYQNHQALWRILSQLAPLALRELQSGAAPPELTGWLELAYLIKTTRPEPHRLAGELDQWRARYPDHPAAERLLDEIVAEQRRRHRRPDTVALLLPLSGDLAGAAAAIRDGFLAAHYAGGQSDTTIRIYDTSPHKDDIWSVYKQASDDGAAYIVGPLRKENVTTLASAGDLDVPVLALNVSRDAAVQPPENFYQFGLAPEDEARQIAERASLEGYTRAVTLVPRGEWGERLNAAFRKRFEELGGEVLEQQRYRSSANDFSDPIQRMLNLDSSERRYRTVRRMTGKDIEFEPRRRQDVEFIFMAAFPRQARLIAPQLRFHRASDLPVYATSHIYSGNPSPDDDRDMNGVIFCDTPWTLSGGGQRHPLHVRLESLFPDAMQNYARLYGLGIDAYRLVPYLQWLRNEPYERFAGVTGSLSMDAQNRIHRLLRWARFTRGQPKVIRQTIQPTREEPQTIQN